MDWMIADTSVHGAPAKLAKKPDGSWIKPFMTDAGHIRYEAWSPKRGLVATDRGAPKAFRSLSAAQRALDS